MEKMTLHVKEYNEEFPIVKIGIIKGRFYLLYEFKTDYCTHGLAIIEGEPKDMEKETLEQFLYENFDNGCGLCGTLEEMETELESFMNEF